jgi:dephospho-CoA kinase
MLVVGLTGGICSGKSLCDNMFQALGIHTIDADTICKQITQPHSENAKQIIAHLGNNIATTHDTINRTALAQRIFNDPTAKQWLENLLHPQIRTHMAKAIQHTTSPYAICIIPLLAETWPNPLVNRVLVIDTLPSNQIMRLQHRNQLSPEEAQQRINQQASRKTRRHIADDIIENNSDLTTLKNAISQQHQLYLRLAQQNNHQDDVK